MTVEELLKTMEHTPDDWNIAPWGERQGIMNGSWQILFIATFPRQYSYKAYTRQDYRKELQLDQIVLYAQSPETSFEDESGSWGRSVR